MSQTPEGKVKGKITKILREAHASYFFPATGGYGRSGVSDIVACYKGQFIAIEAKATSRQKPTALQQAYIDEVWWAGGSAIVIHADNIDDVKTLLDTIDALNKVRGEN